MARTIATTTRVDLEGLLDFVRPRHQMVLMTTRADGRPQASPVTGGLLRVTPTRWGPVATGGFPARLG
jgi:hypothetical protein